LRTHAFASAISSLRARRSRHRSHAWSGPHARPTGLHKSDRPSGREPRSVDEEPHSGGQHLVLRGNLLGRRPSCHQGLRRGARAMSPRAAKDDLPNPVSSRALKKVGAHLPDKYRWGPVMAGGGVVRRVVRWGLSSWGSSEGARSSQASEGAS
jgi:hypothetical protein